MESVLILGNPNSGKTLLFNRLTGLNQKVANFPGVTVEIRSGQSEGILYQDFPGTYSLKPLTLDEQVAIEGFKKAVLNPQTKSIICVLDATRLERSLYLLLQLIPIAHKAQCPLVAAINVIDEVIGEGIKMDFEGLQNTLGCFVVGVSAKTGSGLENLKKILQNIPHRQNTEALQGADLNLEYINSKDEIINLKIKAQELSRKYGPRNEVLLVSQHKLDNFFLSTYFGPIVFGTLMLFLFQAIFSWASPMMDIIDTLVSSSGEFVASQISIPILSDFTRDAIFAGLGSFLVFAPQIFVLFLIIGILEDSGYLARTTVILHRPLSLFGLSGKSFVTMLSGHACAIPAIMAARTIESPRKRLLTILATPFMSCSARLPVYALLVGGFVPATTYFGGLIGLRGIAFFALFAIGIITALLATAFLNNLLPKNSSSQFGDAPFVVELPPYRLPNLKPILRSATNRTWGFIQNAGFMIFSVTVVIWIMGYFPNGSGHLDSSWLGYLGKWIEPIFAPMGMDWKIGVAVITSFLAREVFVGTLGTLYGIDSAEEHMASLSQNLQTSGMGVSAAIALAVFYSLAMQCVSTLAVIKKETGSSKIPIYVFIGMTLIAYGAASATFFILRLFFN